MAVAQCTLIVNLIVGAVWLGLWLGYGKAENCDKKLQLWYDLVLGGMAFGLACDVGVVIAAKRGPPEYPTSARVPWRPRRRRGCLPSLDGSSRGRARVCAFQPVESRE